MIKPIRDQWDIRECPNCGASRGGPRGVHSHHLTVWCLRCEWSQNVKREGVVL